MKLGVSGMVRLVFVNEDNSFPVSYKNPFWGREVSGESLASLGKQRLPVFEATARLCCGPEGILSVGPLTHSTRIDQSRTLLWKWWECPQHSQAEL